MQLLNDCTTGKDNLYPSNSSQKEYIKCEEMFLMGVCAQYRKKCFLSTTFCETLLRHAWRLDLLLLSFKLFFLADESQSKQQLIILYIICMSLMSLVNWTITLCCCCSEYQTATLCSWITVWWCKPQTSTQTNTSF